MTFNWLVFCLGECNLKSTPSFVNLTQSKFVQDYVRYDIMCLIFDIEPDMLSLQAIVIPEVGHKWSSIAIRLDFTYSRRTMISEKCVNDPEKCCKEMFDHWLNTDDGIQPKTWGTLLKVLRDVKLTAAAENIEKKIYSKAIINN